MRAGWASAREDGRGGEKEKREKGLFFFLYPVGRPHVLGTRTPGRYAQQPAVAPPQTMARPLGGSTMPPEWQKERKNPAARRAEKKGDNFYASN